MNYLPFEFIQVIQLTKTTVTLPEIAYLLQGVCPVLMQTKI